MGTEQLQCNVFELENQRRLSNKEVTRLSAEQRIDVAVAFILN